MDLIPFLLAAADACQFFEPDTLEPYGRLYEALQEAQQHACEVSQ